MRVNGAFCMPGLGKCRGKDERMSDMPVRHVPLKKEVKHG